jgi:cysteine desulfurase
VTGVGRRVYLDDAGSAPILSEVRTARLRAPAGNPSSIHTEGREARAALDAARDRAGRALGVDPAGLVFCGSGTEAVNLALLGAGRRLAAGRSVVTWAAEHQSVLGAARRLTLDGLPVEVLPVDAAGLPDPSRIPAEAGLVSIGLANNETGTLQPVVEIAERARAVGALLHVDCCQGPRWVRPPVELCDLASFSGQKLGAGAGGLLYARRELVLDPLQHGGPQEFGRRGGHVDVGQAVATSAALEVSARERDGRAEVAAPFASRVREALRDAGGQVVGGEPRLPNFACAAFPDRRGEDLLLALDLAGVAASSGSACASGSLDPSHVLLAMGLSLEAALGSLRLTVGYDTEAGDVDRAIAALRALPAPVSARG